MKTKFFKKLGLAFLGFAMAAGVGVGIAGYKENNEVNATSTLETTFTSKAWADSNNSWTSDKDAYQYNNSNVQITTGNTGAGATTKTVYNNISKIQISASTTSKGVGNITVKVGTGTAQQICSISKNGTATWYTLDYSTPVSGKVTFVVNCSTNSMYVQGIKITYVSETYYNVTTNGSSNVSFASETTGTNKCNDGENYTTTISANSGYSLPESIEVKVGTTNPTILEVATGTSPTTGYTYDKITGVILVYKGSITGPINIKANGSANSYSITYYLDDGTNHVQNPANYTIETETITLQNPTKSGFVFINWYTDSDFTQQCNTITKGSTGNKTFYAKWGNVPSSLTINAIDGKNYYVGQAWDLTNVEITAHYEGLDDIIIPLSDTTYICDPEYASSTEVEEFTIFLEYLGVEAERKISVSVAENTVSLTWSPSFSFAFYIGDKIEDTNVKTLKATWDAATTEHEKVEMLSFGANGYSLGFYASTTNKTTVENIPEIKIESLPYTFTGNENGLYIGASYAGKITFKTKQFLKARTVTGTVAKSAIYDFSDMEPSGTYPVPLSDSNVNEFQNQYSSTDKVQLPSLSGYSDSGVYLGNGDGGPFTQTGNLIRLGKVKNSKTAGKFGVLTFTFDSSIQIKKVTIWSLAWSSSEFAVISVTNSTDYTAEWNEEKKYNEHQFVLSTTTNVVTIETDKNQTSTDLAKRVVIEKIVFETEGTDIGKSDSCYNLLKFINDCMHPEISFNNTNDTGACRPQSTINPNGKNYYEIAEIAFNNLTADERELFATNTAYSNEFARLQAWATANNKVLNKDSFTLEEKSSKVTILLNNNNSNINIIIIVSLVGLTAIGGYFFYKKRKEN